MSDRRPQTTQMTEISVVVAQAFHDLEAAIRGFARDPSNIIHQDVADALRRLDEARRAE